MSNSIISSRNLNYSVGGKSLLREISFSVEKGAWVSLIGPNGAGKTTLLRCLLGSIQGQGEIILNGASLKSYSSKERARFISYVPQKLDVVFSFSVLEFLKMSQFAFSSANKMAAVEEALHLFKLSDFASAQLTTLSGGELQRVLLACCSVQDTPIMLLDEPTAFLDPWHEQEFYLLLEQLQKEKEKTIIMVTHDINRALLHTTHTLMLENGSISYNGPSEHLLQSTAQKDFFIRSFSYVAHPENGKTMLCPKMYPHA